MENKPIILEELSDLELLTIVNKLDQQFFSEGSIIRTLTKQYFNNDGLPQIIALANKILPVVAERMRAYSPHIEDKYKI